MRLAAVCLAVLVASSAVSSAEGPSKPGPGEPARNRPCGHVPELEAAKHALANGDREGALLHLRRARALVAECERNAVDPPRERGTPASALAKAPAGPEDPGYSYRFTEVWPRI